MLSSSHVVSFAAIRWTDNGFSMFMWGSIPPSNIMNGSLERKNCLWPSVKLGNMPVEIS